MKMRWLASLILGSALTVPAFARVGVYIGVAPPPLRYEVRASYSGSRVCMGRWLLELGRSQDMYGSPGVWRRPPYAGAYWSHPHYDRYPNGWAFHEGHWDREDHGDHHDWGRR